MNARSCTVRFVEPNEVDEVLRYYEETDDENNIGRGAEELRRAARDHLLFGVYDGGTPSGVAGAFWLPEDGDDLSENHMELGGTHLLEAMQGVGLQKRLLIPLRLASAIVLHPPNEGLWSAVKPENIASRMSVENNGFEESTDPPECLFDPCVACKTPPESESDRRCCCDMWTLGRAGAQMAMEQLLQTVDGSGRARLEKGGKELSVDCSAIHVVTQGAHRGALTDFIEGKVVPRPWA